MPMQYKPSRLSSETVCQNIYVGRHEALAPKNVQAAADLIAEWKIPGFGMVEEDEEGVRCIGANLTITWGDFQNVFHTDGDVGPAFGTWFLSRDNGELVMEPEEIQGAVEGGCLVFPEYKIAIDFGACAGVVDVLWHGSEDLHCTAFSKTKPGYRRIGTSCQLSAKLHDRIVSIRSEGEVPRVRGMKVTVDELTERLERLLNDK
ncbi:hypothetical protein FRC12_024900 [Ceratobasidium sp. 428]|nr:hypothetical protein FRC09_004876 [Ceratobasidium sp. 395]KAG8794320.1 hypothetical protein FRC12_024900 [Ceratobasidium sp. 428]